MNYLLHIINIKPETAKEVNIMNKTRTALPIEQTQALSLKESIYLKMLIDKAANVQAAVRSLLVESCPISPNQNPESHAGPQ